jgi:guanylate kinase
MTKGQLLLIAAPSGAGKNSFLSRALRDFPVLSDVVTYTTRAKRHDEVPGKDYHFISDEDFRKKVDEDFFAEWAQVHDKHYGTSRKSLQEIWDRGQVGIMDVDVQGVKTLKSLFPQAISIFILPPSFEELKLRILARDKRPPANLELRLENARKEMARAEEFDIQVVNDELEKSYAQFKKIVEELLTNRIG